MNKQYHEVTHENEIDEVLFLSQILHDCHVFLQKWNVLVGSREETVENAFVAVTELERTVRERRARIAKRIGHDIEPF